MENSTATKDDDSVHLDEEQEANNKSSNGGGSIQSDNGKTSSSSSNHHHSDRVEKKIDEREEEMDSPCHHGRQRRGELTSSTKNKEVLNSSRVTAAQPAATNNSRCGSASSKSSTVVEPASVVPAVTSSSSIGVKKGGGQHKKRKSPGDNDNEDNGSKTSNDEEIGLKMRIIKRKKMATRQSKAAANKRSTDEDDDEEEEVDGGGEEEDTTADEVDEHRQQPESPSSRSPPHATAASSPSTPRPPNRSIINEEHQQERTTKKEKKRKLSTCSGSALSGGKGLSKTGGGSGSTSSSSSSPPSSSSSSSSCQQRSRKRSSLTLSSTSAPTSPSAAVEQPISITSLGSTTPISTRSASNIDCPGEMRNDKDHHHHQSGHKKPKMDPKEDTTSKEEEEKEKAIAAAAGLISDTVTSLLSPPFYNNESREKCEQEDVGTWVRTIGTTTEPECFGPCEPGTSVTLEGIVWNETKGGILVVNVTWRGKTYVGTLLDCTKYDWAPPASCDSPNGSGNENDSNGHWSGWAPSNYHHHHHHHHHRSSKSTNGSAANGGNGGTGGGGGRGRKGHAANRAAAAEAKRHQQQQQQQSNSEDQNTRDKQPGAVVGKKRPTTISGLTLEPGSPVLFQCPFGSCEKKFSAVCALKYHQTTSHRNVTCKNAEKQLSPFALGGRGGGGAKSSPKETVDGVEMKPNLEELFKHAARVASKAPTTSTTAAASQPDPHTNSPVYSDISEDDNVTGASVASTAPPLLGEAIAPVVVIPQLATAITEKPMAIVEPQCAPPSSSSAARGVSADHRGTVPPSLIGAKPAPTSTGVITGSPRKSSAADVKRFCEPLITCPPLLPSLDSSAAIHKKPVGKLEPHSPRSTSVALEFAVPAPPPPGSAMGPGSSPLSVPMVPSSSSMAHSNRPSPQAAAAMNMINQLNHPAFMFNPFNPTNAAAMFPGGQMVPQSVFQSQGLAGLDPAAAAALMAAGQQYGFPMGLHSPTGSHPGSMAGLFGGSPMPPGFVCSSSLSLPTSAMQLASSAAAAFQVNSSTPSATSQQHQHQQQQSSPLAAANRLQQAHKIHELTEHAKRVQSAAAANDSSSVIVEALRRSQVANMSPSPGATQRSAAQRAFGGTAAVDHPSESPRHSSSSSSFKPNPSAVTASTGCSAVPTSVIASSIDYASAVKVAPPPQSPSTKAAVNTQDSGKQQQQGQQLSTKLGVVASSASRTGLSSVSPPVQRHLHTHHHTHAYPALLAPGIDHYSAIVASQQAAAAAANMVGGGFSPFGSTSKQ